jgi:c-di-GMP-binding flagellar brake protein YcgR
MNLAPRRQTKQKVFSQHFLTIFSRYDRLILMSNPENNRKTSRLNAYHLVKYRVMSKPNSPLVLTSAENIGGGGICIHTQEIIPVAETLQIFINFPHMDAPIPTVAKVIWVKRLKSQEAYQVGVQFLEIEEMVRQKVIKHLDFVKEKIEKNK